jgi:hypothetical protein
MAAGPRRQPHYGRRQPGQGLSPEPSQPGAQVLGRLRVANTPRLLPRRPIFVGQSGDVGDWSRKMLNAFKAGWRHGRDHGDGLRSYSVWTRASAYRVGLRLGRLVGSRLRSIR